MPPDVCPRIHLLAMLLLMLHAASFQCLIVNPPRKGLDPGLVLFLTGKHDSSDLPPGTVEYSGYDVRHNRINVINKCTTDLRRIIYISCHFKTFEENARYAMGR